MPKACLRHDMPKACLRPRGDDVCERRPLADVIGQLSFDLLEHIGPLGLLRLHQRAHGGAQLGQQLAVGRRIRCARLAAAGDTGEEVRRFLVEARNLLVAHQRLGLLHQLIVAPAALDLELAQLALELWSVLPCEVAQSAAPSSTTASKSALLHCGACARACDPIARASATSQPASNQKRARRIPRLPPSYRVYPLPGCKGCASGLRYAAVVQGEKHP